MATVHNVGLDERRNDDSSESCGDDVPRKAKQPTGSTSTRSRNAQSEQLRAPDLYLNQHLSWLEFNRRVLDEALDDRNPLLERVKFLSIFSSNLDEFFMVRVASLKSQVAAGTAEVGRDAMAPIDQIAAIKLIVSDLSTRQRVCWTESILPLLKAEGVVLEHYPDLSTRDRKALSRYFERQVLPVLTPLAIDAGHPFPHISNLSLNMLISIEDERGEHFARMKIPQVLTRFIRIPDADGVTPSPRRKQRFVLLEDVIEANVEQLFPGKHVKSTHIFRITRDADLDVRAGGDESLLQTIEAELEQRLFGFVVRLTVEPSMPTRIRAWLADKLSVPNDDIYVLERPHGLSNLMELYSLDRPDLKDPPFTPNYPPELRATPTIFDALREGDVLLYHPYDSFTPVVDFVRQAASDTHVVAFKQTLYRVGSHSPIVDALRDARDDETQIAVLVELLARFDEESNINWARQLEAEGVHVAYGLPGLKTHCKLAMAVRREGDELRRYVHLGTGNYNASTARLYTDIGLMTVDEDIAADVTDVFNFLTGYSAQTEYRKLLIAPVNMRARLMALIQKEARFGDKGRVIIKVNSVTDFPMIEALYRAAQAGVRIDMIVRGMCSLRPGVPGVSENIRVISIVGRFLEHARIFYFGHGATDDTEAIYAGSADLMRRNLDRRVEVLFPIEDRRHRDYLRDGVLKLQLRDNVHARELQRDGSYIRIEPKENESAIDSQEIHSTVDRAAALRAVLALRDSG